jgi:hypothetical protein
LKLIRSYFLLAIFNELLLPIQDDGKKDVDQDEVDRYGKDEKHH